jgi:hypothetical protein
MLTNQTTVTGEREILARLKHLDSKGQRKVTRAAIGAGQTVIRKEMRAQIPPDQKDVRKTVASRYKRKKSTKLMEAKVGIGVGKQTGGRPQLRLATRPGVGISKANVHWWALGTGQRKTKSGESRGSMPDGPDVVKRAYAASESRAYQAMIAKAREKIQQEAVKTR